MGCTHEQTDPCLSLNLIHELYASYLGRDCGYKNTCNNNDNKSYLQRVTHLATKYKLIFHEALQSLHESVSFSLSILFNIKNLSYKISTEYIHYIVHM